MADRDSPEGQAGRAAQGAARRAGGLPVPRRARPVIYVGKAKSIRKRVASHFSTTAATSALDRPHRVARGRHRGRGAARRAELHQAVPPAVQHPAARRQVLPVHRDLLDEDFPRVYFTRERHRRDRRTSAPTPAPSACAARSTCSASSSCSAPARRRAGSAVGLAVPGLLHQALRGALRRLRDAGGVPRGHRRRRSPSSRAATGRWRPNSSSRCGPRCRGEQRYRGHHARERNRLRGCALAARAPARRERVRRGRSTRSTVAVHEATRRTPRCFRFATASFSDRQKLLSGQPGRAASIAEGG